MESAWRPVSFSLGRQAKAFGPRRKNERVGKWRAAGFADWSRLMNRRALGAALVIAGAGVGFEKAWASGANSAESRIAVVAESLRNEKATAGAVLTAKVNADLRGRRAFRNLIREHAPTGELTIVSEGEAGEPLVVEGKVTAANGAPIPGALLYAYQTDATGVYSIVGGNATLGDALNPRLYGYVRTDDEGRYRFRTIRPGPYPQSGPAAHIHFEIEADGFQRRVTEIMFGDCPRMSPETRAAANQAGYPIVDPTRDGSGSLKVSADFKLERGSNP